jgi:hypothetical protein
VASTGWWLASFLAGAWVLFEFVLPALLDPAR